MKSDPACEFTRSLKPPKLLPWLAAEACIDEDTALDLWHTAVLQARGEGASDAAITMMAMARFRDALAEERKNAGIRVFMRTMRVMQRRFANQLAALLAVGLLKSSRRVMP